MTGPRLKSISIDGFRSINTPVELRLDAPMVLIHGQNGAGKTSLLSALELALTGSVPSLERVDKGYRKELANYTTGEGLISLRVDGLGDEFRDTDIRLTRGTTRTQGGLSEQAARFYSERCYLAQTTLSQLLAIYGGEDASIDTPLSQFAAELLGLDRLDALQRGLQPAKDARNLRPLAPTYRTLENRREALAQSVAEATTDLKRLDARIADARGRLDRIRAGMLEIGGEEGQTAESARLAVSAFDDQIRRIEELTRSSARIRADRAGAGREEVVTTARKREAEAAVWLSANSDRIQHLLLAVVSHVPDVPTGITADVGADIERLADQLETISNSAAAAVAKAKDAERRLKELDDELVSTKTTTDDLDRELSELGREAPDLAAALSTVIPHIHGDDCPVCSRDYGEISETPLAEAVHERIQAITSAASRLAEATGRRTSLAARIAEIDRERELLVAQLPSESRRLEDQAAAATLAGLVAEASEVLPIAREGGSLLRQQAEAVRLAAGWSRSDVEDDLLSQDVAVLEDQLGIASARTDSSADRLASMSLELGDRRARLTAWIEQEAIASTVQRELMSMTAERVEVDAKLRAQVAARKRADDAFRATTAIRRSVGRIADAATDARTRVVAEVFNDKLNALWRDLFVRLAPDEEFVPVFDVPVGKGGRVRPVLRTRHRFGDDGGSPGVMLSSGNLNTAALTLFLALHLSAQPKLPWLVLDDPVQSMDDVHIAHFAALLRTLSKEHGRQIVVAVHDRALFDYLALEMSPAFPTDELITVELERTSDGKTRYSTARHGYRERPKIVAAAA
ncbi:AAA family ATPase [Parablastomonas sp. CN1-191]|uniref:ATP-binding protein n=1 Tax=Parablastomonas sp. CN1-191 TaxID=3400908 RepID=UPI003BF7FC72